MQRDAPLMILEGHALSTCLEFTIFGFQLNSDQQRSMSSARLEILKDDDEPIQVCRSMPAALEGLLSRASFCDFCDKLDDSLQRLEEAHKRFKTRICWKWVAVYIWIFGFSFSISSYMLAFQSTPSILLFVLGYMLLLRLILSTIDYFVNFNVPRDALTDKQLMRKLRRDCEEMTLHTPHVSFHIVLQPIPPLQMKFLALEVVDHIAVSLSSAATIRGGTSVIASLMTTGDDSATACKIMEHEAATATPGNATAIVFAEAMISGAGHTGSLSSTSTAYQRVASDDDDDNNAALV